MLAAAVKARLTNTLVFLPVSLFPSRRGQSSSSFDDDGNDTFVYDVLNDDDSSFRARHGNDESSELDYSRGYLKEWREQQERRKNEWMEAQRERTEHRAWVETEWARMRARWANGEGVGDAAAAARNVGDGNGREDAPRDREGERESERGGGGGGGDRAGTGDSRGTRNAGEDERGGRTTDARRGSATNASRDAAGHTAGDPTFGGGGGGHPPPRGKFRWWWEGGERHRWPEEEWARAKAGVDRQGGFFGGARDSDRDGDGAGGSGGREEWSRGRGAGGGTWSSSSSASWSAADAAHYQTLGLPVGSPATDVHAAFRAAAMEVRERGRGEGDCARTRARVCGGREAGGVSKIIFIISQESFMPRSTYSSRHAPRDARAHQRVVYEYVVCKKRPTCASICGELGLAREAHPDRLAASAAATDADRSVSPADAADAGERFRRAREAFEALREKLPNHTGRRR